MTGDGILWLVLMSGRNGCGFGDCKREVVDVDRFGDCEGIHR